MKAIIRNNIRSHHVRNNNIGLIFGISISFIIFSGSGFIMLQSLIDDLMHYMKGADLIVEQMNFGSSLREIGSLYA